MRLTVGTMLGVFLVVGACCASAAAEETHSSWWPFGGGSQSEPAAAGKSTGAASSPKDTDTTPTKDRPWMIQSPSTKVSWPEFRMPQTFSTPHLPHPQIWPNSSKPNTARNSWVEKKPAPSHPSPLQVAKNGVHRVTEGTKTAWHNTVGALTPGDGKSEEHPRMAHRDPKPSLWQRMFGSQDEKPQGPRTVSEWMAQDRLDP